MLSSNVYYIINPQLRMCRESTRCIIYTVDDFFLSVENLSVVSTYEIVFLMLFDGSRLLNKVEKDFEYLFERQIDIQSYYSMLNSSLGAFG